ncbi:MAG: hypothetical protein K8F25_01470 [Fimbriimonadaceae bacterium]|nr:hypothetical protein [Alphaproteobacteria bacterium]
MADEIEIIPPDRFQTQPRIDAASGPPANPISRFVDKMRRKSIEERQGVVRALTGLLDDMRGLNGAYADYQKSLTRLKNLDKSLEIEERRFLATLDSEERQFVLQLRNDELRLMTEQLDLELRHEQAQRKLDQFRSPPQHSGQADPIKTRIDATLHGGRYAKHVEEEAQRIFKQYGGENNVPADVMERIRNARRHAAQGDEGKG